MTIISNLRKLCLPTRLSPELSTSIHCPGFHSCSGKLLQTSCLYQHRFVIIQFWWSEFKMGLAELKPRCQQGCLLFQLLEAACVLDYVLVLPSLVLLPPSYREGPCDDIEPTGTSQDNLPVPTALTQTHLQSLAV